MYKCVCSHWVRKKLIWRVFWGCVSTNPCDACRCTHVCFQHVGATHSWVCWMSWRTWLTRLTWYTGFSIITRRAAQSLESRESERGDDLFILNPFHNSTKPDTDSCICGCETFCLDLKCWLIYQFLANMLCFCQDIQWNLPFTCNTNDTAWFFKIYFNEPLAVNWSQKTDNLVLINHPQNAAMLSAIIDHPAIFLLTEHIIYQRATPHYA